MKQWWLTMRQRATGEPAAARADDGVEFLRKSHDVLSFAMRGGRMGAWSRDLRTDEVWWSTELEALFGLPPGGFEGTREGFLALVHPDDKATLREAIDHALATRQDYAAEFRFRHADGNWRWMEGRGRATYDEQGRPTMLYGLGIDIGDRKQAEAIVLRHTAIFEHQTDAIIVTDPDGLILDVNPASERMLGWRRDEVLGRGVSMFHRAQDMDRITQEGLQAVAEHGEWRSELIFVRKDRSEGICECVVKPLKDPSGRTIGTVGVNRDITERRRTEDELRRLNERLSDADRRKDEFLAMLAHELRNPLAPIRNAVEVMRLRDGDNPATQAPRAIIERQLRQMTRLVDDLLDVARITRGKTTLRLEPVAVAGVLDSALEAARPLIDQCGHQLELHIPRWPIIVNADPVRLTQVVLNLLNNAATYTPRGGRIRLSAHDSGGQAVISVRDDGIGIDAQHLHGIFELFSQLTPVMERTHGGLGIGLALVQGLVTLHGGRVEARSEGPGRGSEFVVHLPLASSAAVPSNGGGPSRVSGDIAAPATAALPQRPLRILVVDDNVDAADSLALMLQLSGHEVTTAHGGEAAVSSAAASRPDVVLLDIGLPGMNGYEAARLIRAQRPAGGAPALLLVALTGWSQDSDKRRALEAGFDHHLTKPVDPIELSALLTLAAMAQNTPGGKGSTGA